MSRRSRSPAASRRARSCFARVMRATRATSSAPARPAPIREHSDGRSITLANFGPGDIFGELAMFDNERRSASVEAIADHRGDRNPRWRHAAPAAPASGYRDQAPERARPPPAARPTSGSRDSRFKPCRAALRRCCCSLSPRREPRAAYGDVLITSTQADLAQLAGSSRESASRFLAVLERAGVIKQGRGKLTVHDAEALKRYVY